MDVQELVATDLCSLHAIIVIVIVIYIALGSIIYSNKEFSTQIGRCMRNKKSMSMINKNDKRKEQ